MCGSFNDNAPWNEPPHCSTQSGVPHALTSYSSSSNKVESWLTTHLIWSMFHAACRQLPDEASATGWEEHMGPRRNSRVVAFCQRDGLAGFALDKHHEYG